MLVGGKYKSTTELLILFHHKYAYQTNSKCITLTTIMAIFPPTSPTTLIGGLAFGRNPKYKATTEH